MIFLPNDVLNKIVDQLDIVSLVRLNATCKTLHRDVPLSKRTSEHPIQYVNKMDNTCKKYTNLNDMIDDIHNEILLKDDVNCTTLFKEYTTTREHSNYTLQLHRNCVSKIRQRQTYVYSFVIRKRYMNKYIQFQFIYDPIQETYIGMRHMGCDFQVPLLFLFIGCKILFKIHGYTDIKSFAHLPQWFTKILLHKKYSGLLLKDIVNGFATI